MNRYFAILKMRVAAIAQYRSAAFAGICAQLFWGFISIMIFKAFYSGVSTPEPLSLVQTLTFVWLGQTLVPLLPWHPDREIEAQIRSGQVAYDLIRPVNLYATYLTKSFALRLTPLLMRSIPFFLIVILFLELKAPHSPLAGLGFVCSVCLATLLSAVITALTGVTLFWTLSGTGINRMLPHCASLLSGNFIPLPLFPSWLQPFLSWQPFRGIVDIPCRIYTGVIPEHQISFYLGFQLAWALVFIWLGNTLLSRSLKRLVVQGG